MIISFSFTVSLKGFVFFVTINSAISLLFNDSGKFSFTGLELTVKLIPVISKSSFLLDDPEPKII